MKDIVKLALILAAYTAAACVGLAFVYAATAETIEQGARAEMETALKELFSGADGFEEITGTITSPDPGVSFGAEYKVSAGGKVIGAALEASAGSYGGPIKVLVGVNADGTVSRIKILEHSDTPGLGAKAASPSYFVNREKGITFFGQFEGKSLSDPFEPKKDVIAITASTITSRAVSGAVQAAGKAAFAWLSAEGAEGAGK